MKTSNSLPIQQPLTEVPPHDKFRPDEQTRSVGPSLVKMEQDAVRWIASGQNCANAVCRTVFKFRQRFRVGFSGIWLGNRNPVWIRYSLNSQFCHFSKCALFKVQMETDYNCFFGKYTGV